MGFQITGDANNGRDGFRLICDKQPDIAVIDINMPLINGLELIEKLRKEQIPCKCILLTGYSDFKYAQQAIRLNVSEYILKPVDFSLLTESLNNLKQEISQDQIDVVVSVRAAMIARDWGQFMEFMEICEKAQVEVLCLDEVEDAGRIFQRIQKFIAAYFEGSEETCG